MLVEDITVEGRSGFSLLTASVIRESDGLARRAEYRFHNVPSEGVSERGDAFVAGLLLPAMRAGEKLEISAPVSPQLMTRVNDITKILSEWRPRLRRVKVTAPVAALERGGSGIGLFFSGGVDSQYSLLENLEQHPMGEDAITHLIFVLGIDSIYGYDQRYLDGVSSMMREIAQETGKQALILETNVRSDFAPPSWTIHQGSALISAGLALSPLLGRCVIAGGFNRDETRPGGTHPLLDPLWSTETLEVVHDAGEADRIDKISTRIARSQLALRTLRVCFEVEQQPKNCGRCGKCLQTMIGLHAAGALESCSTFVAPLDVKRVRKISVGPRRLVLERLLGVLGESTYDRRLARAIRLALWKYGLTQAIRRRLRPLASKKVAPGSRPA